MSVENRITIGHVEAVEKLTARVLYRRRGEKGYIDCGNVREFTDATTRSLVTRARAAYGMRHVNNEQTDVNHESFTFLLDERDTDNERLLRLARQVTQLDQAAVEGATATLEDVVNGRWFPVGAYNIGNVLVTGLAGELTEGTDYELDKENGRIRIIPDADVSDGEDLTVTFDEPGLSFERFESQYDRTMYGDFIIEEYNQFSRMFLRRMSFYGFLNVTEFPTQTGEFGTFRVKVTPNGPITYIKRPEGATLSTVTESDEGAAASSSSSSRSSSSSGESSASSSS